MLPQTERLIVKPASWPIDDRRRWEKATIGEGFKGMENPAVRWVPKRRKIVEDSFGRFLGWLTNSRGPTAESSAVKDITSKNIKAYIAYLRETLAPWSVTTYFGGLLRFVAVTTPKMEVDWMQDRYRKMKTRSVSTRPKTAHLQHTGDLVEYGLELMRQVEGKNAPKHSLGVRAAQKYQAGLMIAILAVAPLRIRNFQDIEIGKSLVWEQGRYILRFDPEHTKTGAESKNPLPVEFEPYLKAFCTKYRSVLMKKSAGKSISNYFWIDRGGEKMNEATLRETIKRWTKLKFGKHLWPHLFRDAAATSIAQDDPEHVGIVTSVLSHASIATAKRHYDQSTSLKANKRAAEAVFALRMADGSDDDDLSIY